MHPLQASTGPARKCFWKCFWEGAWQILSNVPGLQIHRTTLFNGNIFKLVVLLPHLYDETPVELCQNAHDAQV